MINTKREGLSQRQGYPLFTPLYAAVSIYMKGEIQFEICSSSAPNSKKKTTTNPTDNREKNAHIFNTQAHPHTLTRHMAYHLWPSISAFAVEFAPRIVSSWVFSDQWEETQIWVMFVGGEWLTAETAARLPQEDSAHCHRLFVSMSPVFVTPAPCLKIVNSTTVIRKLLL